MEPKVFYDSREQILFIEHPTPVELTTRQAITRYFDTVLRYWRTHCAARRVYIVVDYDNFSFNHELREVYAAQIGAGLGECSLGVARFGGTFGQRAAARTNAIDLHMPSNIYSSRDEAIEVVRGLRSGKVRQG